jgi:retron-type reverse transcriptase
MSKRLKTFFDKNKTLYDKQYGFRAKHSTQHAIIDIINNIHNNMDKGLFSCGIFIDLKKAFDTVDHSILLHKLHHYGIRGVINNWFRSYLTDRIQTTQIGGYISSKHTVNLGVPQGSVLGPLLFLIYINDIHKSSEVFKFYLFADDTNLVYSDKKFKNL